VLQLMSRCLGVKRQAMDAEVHDLSKGATVEELAESIREKGNQ
jgi:hypothetical protein